MVETSTIQLTRSKHFCGEFVKRLDLLFFGCMQYNHCRTRETHNAANFADKVEPFPEKVRAQHSAHEDRETTHGSDEGCGGEGVAGEIG